MRRIIVAAALPLLLGGCVPIGFSIAAYTMDGLSLLASGKTSADHALSAMSGQDCAMLRVVRGAEPCEAYEPGERRTLVAAVDRFPSDRDGIAPSPDAELFPQPVVLPPSTGQLAAALTGSAAADRLPPRATSFAALPGELVLLGRQDAGRQQDVALAAQPRRDSAAERSGTLHYVVGSFLHSGDAERHARRFADHAPVIREAKVDGRVRHRVTVGPVAPDEARALRLKLEAEGAREPWLLHIPQTTVAEAPRLWIR